MRRTPIAHVILPRANSVRPVPEFAWEAARVLNTTRDLDVSIFVPVPVGALRALHSQMRRRRGAAGWPADLETALRRLEPSPIIVPYVPVPRRSTEAAAAAVAARMLALPRAQRPALVQGSFLDEGGYMATRIAKVMGCPSVVVAHGTDVRAARGEVSGIGRTRRAEEALRSATRVVAVSHDLAQQLAMLGCRAEVLPFTTSAARFPLVPPTRGGREILFVGRVSQAKGVHRLLEALPHLAHRDATLRLVGPVVDVDVDAIARGADVFARVIVEGERPQGDLPELYAGATCLALPSSSEGLPCVVVESLLVGRPVVATRVGGLVEIVTPNVGALVEDADPRALAQALDAVLDQASRGVYDPHKLRAHAFPYAWESVGPRLADLVRATLTTTAA